MAANKESFILYSNIIHTIGKLSDEQAGKLFKIILEYVNDLNPSVDDLLLQIAFEPIKQKLKEDLIKWESVCKRNQENGSKGGRPKNPEEPQKPTGLNGIPKEPKKADSDCDNDYDNEKNKKNILLSELSDSDVSNPLYLKITKSFHSLFIQNQKSFNVDTSKLEKANGFKWYDTIRLMMEVDKVSVEDCRKLHNFIAQDIFWKSNCHSVSSLRKNATQMLIKASATKQIKEKKQESQPQTKQYSHYANI